MDFFAQILASLFGAYLLTGALYLLRLSWPSIQVRYSGVFALLCAWALWPLILWGEVGHAVSERQRRAYRVPSEEYLRAVARLTRERRRRDGL